MNIYDYSILPSLTHAFSITDHDLSIAFDSIRMKCRLYDTPLSIMIFTLARYQAFSQYALRYLQPSTFYELIVTSDQDIFYKLRIIDQIHVLSTKLEMINIAICRCDFHQHRYWIIEKLTWQLARQHRGRSWGIVTTPLVKI